MDHWQRHLDNNREHDRREQQMAEDYQESLSVTPKEHARVLGETNRALLIMLVVVFVVAALAVTFY
ncbi:hypothetical protein [Rhizobium oryzicola]|uniref:Uncharacterized protein n=1 Tax=Rhizobium oryzicola TaxID=1232668 RepID=A0ABT8SRH1_9HYPH|nr:hypothetical protein [Rhizobium oryzicola]MDO1580936.1 hypothetical protein [Rhizobium oryzicola]